MIRSVLAVFGLALATFMVVPTPMTTTASAAPGGPVSIADVVSSAPFSGTISGQYGVSACPDYDYLTFDGSYPGGTAVGTVNLSVAGCYLDHELLRLLHHHNERRHAQRQRLWSDWVRGHTAE